MFQDTFTQHTHRHIYSIFFVIVWQNWWLFLQFFDKIYIFLIWKLNDEMLPFFPWSNIKITIFFNDRLPQSRFFSAIFSWNLRFYSIVIWKHSQSISAIVKWNLEFFFSALIPQNSQFLVFGKHLNNSWFLFCNHLTKFAINLCNYLMKSMIFSMTNW